jgi:hypothetical protein
MALDPTQVVNNVKRSFNAYVSAGLGPATINFDQDPFEADGLESWYSVRYTSYSTEPSGMGEMIEDDESTKGRFHVVGCEVSAWRRDDPQRAELGGMADELIALCEEPSITLYDYADPENPQECGKVYLRPRLGTFTPIWSGAKPIWKADSERHERGRIVGFVLELELITLAEVS